MCALFVLAVTASVRWITESAGDAANQLNDVATTARRPRHLLQERIDPEDAVTIIWLAIAFFAGSFFGVLIVALGRAAAEPMPQSAQPMDALFADDTSDSRHVA
jgi:hypothetical protein